MSVSQVISSTRTTSDAGDRILRYTLGERINHWIAGLSYVYCLITGLAFWSPYMFWMAIVVGGGPAARFWHPWFGLVFTASVLWMYRIWRSDMVTTDADRAWWKASKYYIRNEGENLPPIGRFNYGQKLFFWLMFYGVILLLLSGSGKQAFDRLAGALCGVAVPQQAGLALTVEADESTTGPAFLTLTDPDGNPVLIDQHVPSPRK